MVCRSASVTQLAECHLAKVDVEGSNPFARTNVTVYIDRIPRSERRVVHAIVFPTKAHAPQSFSPVVRAKVRPWDERSARVLRGFRQADVPSFPRNIADFSYFISIDTTAIDNVICQTSIF